MGYKKHVFCQMNNRYNFPILYITNIIKDFNLILLEIEENIEFIICKNCKESYLFNLIFESSIYDEIFLYICYNCLNYEIYDYVRETVYV